MKKLPFHSLRINYTQRTVCVYNTVMAWTANVNQDVRISITTEPRSSLKQINKENTK